MDASPLYRVRLDVFEGPLDLLLHLVKKNEVELPDIPIAEITDQYLAYLDLLRQLDLDVAGEYLVMAATLLHLKSRLLLPAEETPEEEEQGEDPREDLARQLLEYQRFKEAADGLLCRDLLDRDVFTRTPEETAPGLREDAAYNLTLGDLLDALHDVITRAQSAQAQRVELERISLRDRVYAVLDTVRARGSVRLDELFTRDASRLEVVVTLLAVLELAKTRMVRLEQAARFGPIVARLAVSPQEPLPPALEHL